MTHTILSGHCFAWALVLVTASVTRASVIYGCVSQRLYSIDVDLQQVTPIFQMPTGTRSFEVSAGPRSGALYVNGYIQELGADHLSVYDIATELLTRVGSSTVCTSLGEGRDGYLYYGGSEFGRLDASTGAPTVLNPALHFTGDIATSPGGISLGILSRSGPTGAVSVLARLDRETGEAFDIAELPTNMYGLAFTLDGRLWASDTVRRLYQVDPESGACVVAFNTGIELLDLASEPVPSPGWPGLLSAMLIRRRRR